MNKYSDRLKYALARRGMSQSELARKVGVKPQAIQYLCKEGTQSVHSVKIAEILDINAIWLTDGVGEMDLSLHADQDYIDSYAVRSELPTTPIPSYTLGELELWDGSTPLRDDEVALPYFREVELAAGSGRNEVIENKGMKLRFARSTLKNQGVLECNAACATVAGNSMEPKLHNGTAIGIDKGTTNIIDGEMYAIDHDGSLRVKYLYKMPGGALRLRSENKEEWPDETLPYEEAKKVKVIGWVFWWSTLPKRRWA